MQYQLCCSNLDSICSLCDSVYRVVFFCLLGTMGINDDGFGFDSLPIRAPSGAAKELNPILAAWQVPSVKLLRPGKRSRIDAVNSYEELWAWMKESEKGQLYHSEFCSEDPIIRGVALSRFCESYQHLCEYVVSTECQWGALLKETVFDAVKKEAADLLPHLRGLNGSGMPSRAIGGKKQRLGEKDATIWRDRDETTEHAKAILSWLATSGKSKLRAAIKVMSVAGLTYNCMVDHQTTMAYCRCGNGKDQLVDDAVARLCQGSGTSSTKTIPEDTSSIFNRNDD